VIFGQSEEGERVPTADEGVGGTARWTAPEVISGQTYTEAADVYSYGIILWELATRKIPFEEISNSELPKLVVAGKRPQIPSSSVPEEFADLMKRSWSQSPSSRPLFPSIVDYLRQHAPPLNNAHQDPLSLLEQLQKETDQLKAEKEKLEKEWENTEKLIELEKEKRVELERNEEDIKRKISAEQRKVVEIERQVKTQETNLAYEKQKLAEKEKKRQKEMKEAEKKWKRTEEQLLSDKEEALKKLETEKAKNEQLKKQLELSSG